MSTPTFTCAYSQQEERYHTMSHGIGIVLSLIGLALLVTISLREGSLWHIVSSVIYGVTLVLMYSASTLYHAVSDPHKKRHLRQLDHAAIYLLIAGTYTPFLLVNLRNDWGWVLFAIIWTTAISGVLIEIYQYKPFKRLSLGLYLIMGWLVVFAMKPMLTHVATGGLILLLAGGLAYSIGAIFYVRKQMAYHHVIWHLFVLAGSVFHFFAVLFFVLP